MQLQIYKFQEEDQFSELTTVQINGDVWFVAGEICRVLEIKNTSDVVSRLDDDEKLTSVLPIAGQNRTVNLISESGLYALIFRSNKPSAKKFQKWVTKEVIPSIRKKGAYGNIDRSSLPNFIIRYKDNLHKLDNNYFSVIHEMFTRLYVQLEKVGYVVPDRGLTGKQLMPDISVGRGFASFLKDNNSEFHNTHKKYTHTFPNGKEVQANMYHIDALPMFIRYINEKWIPENAQNYFRERDPIALDYLPKLLGTSSS